MWLGWKWRRDLFRLPSVVVVAHFDIIINVKTKSPISYAKYFDNMPNIILQHFCSFYLSWRCMWEDEIIMICWAS